MLFGASYSHYSRIALSTAPSLRVGRLLPFPVDSKILKGVEIRSALNRHIIIQTSLRYGFLKQSSKSRGTFYASWICIFVCNIGWSYKVFVHFESMASSEGARLPFPAVSCFKIKGLGFVFWRPIDCDTWAWKKWSSCMSSMRGRDEYPYASGAAARHQKSNPRNLYGACSAWLEATSFCPGFNNASHILEQVQVKVIHQGPEWWWQEYLMCESSIHICSWTCLIYVRRLQRGYARLETSVQQQRNICVIIISSRFSNPQLLLILRVVE